MFHSKGILAGVSAFIVLAFTATDASAISAWARKYGVACTACHWAGYRLNREGIKFMRTGHYYKDDKPSTNFEDFLSLNTKIRFNDGADEKSTDNKVGKVTFEHHAFALYSGGLISGNWSFFTELYLHEREGRLKSADVYKDGGRTKLAEAFLQYTKGNEDYMTIRVGQIASQLFYIQGAGGRLSETRNFLVNNATITSNAGIGNTWLPRMRDYGIEVGGEMKNMHWTAGVVNGVGNSPTNVVENVGQSAKDFYTTFDYTFAEKAQVGFFYHNGNLEDPTQVTTNKDDFYRVGATFNFNPNDRMWILGTVLNGKDTDKTKKEGLNQDVKSNGFAIEFDYLAIPDRGIAPFFKFDRFTHDGKSGAVGEYDTTTNVVGAGCTFDLFDAQRARVVFEWQYQHTLEEYTPKVGAATEKDLVKDQNLRIELSFML